MSLTKFSVFMLHNQATKSGTKIYMFTLILLKKKVMQRRKTPSFLSHMKDRRPVVFINV